RREWTALDRLAEYRFLERRRRQLPSPGAGRLDLVVHVNVEEAGLAQSERMPQRVAELIRVLHADALDAEAARHPGKIGVVRFALGPRVETRPDFPPSEHPVLDIPDRGPGEIVPDQPHRGDVVLDGGRQDVRRHDEAAIADDGEAFSLRRGELSTQD